MTTRNILREFIDETLSEMMHPEHVRKALAMEIMEAIEEDQNLYNSMKEAAALEQDPAELAIYKQGLELITRTIEEKKQMLQSLFSKTMGGSGLPESAPPGWKGTVKAMKKHKEIDNPFALAWSMKNKGDKPHYKNSDQSPPKKKKEK